MTQNSLTQYERELVYHLREEYSFYQSLYIMLDKQRDLVKYDQDEKLLDLFAEIERCHARIKTSEDKITKLKETDPRMFRMAAILPEVRKLVNGIATMVKKNVNLVAESRKYMQGRYDRVKQELGELRNSRQILQYLSEAEPSPHFVDGKG